MRSGSEAAPNTWPAEGPLERGPEADGAVFPVSSSVEHSPPGGAEVRRRGGRERVLQLIDVERRARGDVAPGDHPHGVVDGEREGVRLHVRARPNPGGKRLPDVAGALVHAEDGVREADAAREHRRLGIGEERIAMCYAIAPVPAYGA